jgi:hypothetical protein
LPLSSRHGIFARTELNNAIMKPQDTKVTLSKVNGSWIVGKHDFNPPEPTRPKTSPTLQEKQINSEASVIRKENGSFHVRGVLKFKSGGWDHELSIDCPYCRRTLVVVAFGPHEMPKYAKEEACRLALREHFRTDSEHKIKRRVKVD